MCASERRPPRRALRAAPRVDAWERAHYLLWSAGQDRLPRHARGRIVPSARAAAGPSVPVRSGPVPGPAPGTRHGLHPPPDRRARRRDRPAAGPAPGRLRGLAGLGPAQSRDAVFRRRTARHGFRRAPRPLPDRLPDRRHPQRPALERGADLPRADRRPALRPPPPRDGQARLVGDAGGAGQAGRHRPLLRRVLERDRLLHGLDRARLAQPGDRPSLRARLPAGDDPGHGPGPGDAARPARHP
jgi:hypothetical protein